MLNGGNASAVLGLCLAVAVATTACAGQPTLEAQGKGVDLTVYNQNLGLVKERRTLDLKLGVNEVAFQDVAAQIDPTTVLFNSLTDPAGTTVLEQNYEYDIVGSQKLLEKYVDQDVRLVTKDGVEHSGKLLNGSQDIILQAADGQVAVIKLDEVREFSFPKLPEGLITRPTLLWQLEAAKAGAHNVEVTYMTQGINWQADYVLRLDKEDKKIDLDGWITLNNQSGATYKDAKLKLIAGEIHRAAEAVAYGEDRTLVKAAAAPTPGVEERAFFEYHLYDIQRPVTVKDRQTKQIEFAAAAGVPAEKFFVYDGSQITFYGYGPITEPSYGNAGNKKVMVMLEFLNSEKGGLGIPLPKGTVRVYKEDIDGSTQFIGEDSIDHTPKDEKVRLYIGDAFDIVGERKQTDFRTLGERSVEESYEIVVRNHKTEAAQVRVVEHMFRWSEWEIVRSTGGEYTKTDSQTIEYRLNVPADGEQKVEYTVRYRW